MKHPKKCPPAEISNTAIFICSSDGRRDILDRTLPALRKFWAHCPYPIFVGLNSLARPLSLGTPVLAPVSEWHRETACQLSQIRHSHVIVMLDDFLIGAPVDAVRMAALVDEAVNLELSYLRLVPVGRSLMARLTGRRPHELRSGIERVRRGHPFYSSLQIAVWRKRHLQSMLRRPRSIWEFERAYLPESAHYAIRDRPPILYRHLVEKGRWLPDARWLLRRSGLPTELGNRPVWPKSKYAKLCLDQVRWTLLGYATC